MGPGRFGTAINGQTATSSIGRYDLLGCVIRVTLITLPLLVVGGIIDSPRFGTRWN